MNQWKKTFDVRYSVKISSSNSQSREYQRQAKDAVNLLVRESSENYEVMPMRGFQGIQIRYDGRMEEHGRRVTQVIGSEARGAPRGQRSHMLHEHQVPLQNGEREKEFVKSQMHSELQSHIICNRRSLHEREVQQERFAQNWECPEAQLRVQLQIEELMMTSRKESFQETSESERQAVISAQQ